MSAVPRVPKPADNRRVPLRTGERPPWLRTRLSSLVDEYLSTVSFSSGELIGQLRHAVEELKAGDADVHGPGGILLLLSPEQREVFERTKSLPAVVDYILEETRHGLD